MGLNIKALLGLDTKAYETKLERAKRKTNQVTGGIGKSMKSVGGSFGGVTGLIDKFTGGLGSSFMGVSSGLGFATKGMKGFGKAMAVSGVGTLVALFGLLINYLTGTQEGADKLTRIMGGLEGVIGFITDGLNTFTKTIIKAFKDPQQFIDDLIEKIKEIPKKALDNIVARFKAVKRIISGALSLDWDEMKAGASDYFDQTLAGKAVKASKKVGKALAGAYKAGEDAANDKLIADRKVEANLVKIAKAENEIKRIRQQTRDTSLSEEKRVELGNKILDQIKIAKDLELENVNAQIKALEKKQSLSENSHADDLKFQELLAERVNIVGKYDTEREKTIKDQNIALDQQKKKYEDIAKLQGVEVQSGGASTLVDGMLKEHEQLNKITDDSTGSMLSKWEKFKLGLRSMFGEGGNSLASLIGLDEGGVANLMNYGKAAGEMLSAMGEAYDAQMEGELASAGENEEKKDAIRRKYAKKKKRVAIGEAIIQGSLAVLSALNTQPFFPMGLIMAATAGVATGAQISTISAQQFANGGVIPGNSFTGDKIPIMVNSKERVLTANQSDQLTRNLKDQGAGQNMKLKTKVKGSELLIWIAKANQENESF